MDNDDDWIGNPQFVRLVEEFGARLAPGEPLEDLAREIRAQCDPDLADKIIKVLRGQQAAEQFAAVAFGRSSRELDGQDGGSPIEHPAKVGSYEILNFIGAGGMGRVYEATHEILKSRVALKLIRPEKRDNEQFRKAFLREASQAASLRHTNIVPVFQYGEDARELFYAMAFIDGIGLDELIAYSRRAEEIDLRVMCWGDGSQVPDQGKNLIIIGIDDNDRLHVRIFDAAGGRRAETDETKLPRQAAAIDALKRQVRRLRSPARPDSQTQGAANRGGEINRRAPERSASTAGAGPTRSPESAGGWPRRWPMP